MEKFKTISGDTEFAEIVANIMLAIETHSNVAIEYTKDTDANGIREVLPHNLYYSNTDATRIMLDGFQINGASKTGVYNFKQFNCHLIKSCCILNEKFNIQQGYNAESKRYNNSILGIVA